MKKQAIQHETDFLSGISDDRKFQEHIRHLYFRTRPTFYIRLFVELIIPLVFASYSAYSLLSKDISQESQVEAVVEKHANKQINQTVQV
ncbi:hypothetical protein Q4493_10780 [Colwellia sp. 1_MG-2023]|uniref:hypothetical protein n=1 Tax=Colwellia sp. 1_MG-2023 TaxID=3062649 RepID=UPI0026E40D07|nr:hypothetical protein [Colwellia sp. 1_MG-2023]MDO6446256.1 hypothetical protein [Colwellia sp. 1_MG-2023]